MTAATRTRRTVVHQATSRRHGVALVYISVMLLAMMAFCSLAVDLGRVQAAKTELESAAIAASEAAVSGLSTSVSAAQSNAVNMCLANPVDGTPLVLDTTNDIAFGTWSPSAKTFTVLSGAARSGANAVRITVQRSSSRGTAVPLAFAKLLGCASCDVHASATAYIAPTQTNGFVGLNGVNISGSAHIDSYNSTQGQYAPSMSQNTGVVQSNKAITMSGGAVVHGNANPGMGCSVTTSGGSYVSNSSASVTSPIVDPTPTAPARATDLGAINVSGSGSMTIAAGTYTASSLVVSGSATLNITGPVILYVSGKVDISGNASVEGNTPANFNVQVTGSQDCNFSGNTAIDAVVNAPLAKVTISGNSGFCGSAIGATLTISGSGGAHYDLGNAGLSAQPVLVQ